MKFQKGDRVWIPKSREIGVVLHVARGDGAPSYYVRYRQDQQIRFRHFNEEELEEYEG